MGFGDARGLGAKSHEAARQLKNGIRDHYSYEHHIRDVRGEPHTRVRDLNTPSDVDEELSRLRQQVPAALPHENSLSEEMKVALRSLSPQEIDNCRYIDPRAHLNPDNIQYNEHFLKISKADFASIHKNEGNIQGAGELNAMRQRQIEVKAHYLLEEKSGLDRELRRLSLIHKRVQRIEKRIFTLKDQENNDEPSLLEGNPAVMHAVRKLAIKTLSANQVIIDPNLQELSKVAKDLKEKLALHMITRIRRIVEIDQVCRPGRAPELGSASDSFSSSSSSASSDARSAESETGRRVIWDYFHGSEIFDEYAPSDAGDLPELRLRDRRLDQSQIRQLYTETQGFIEGNRKFLTRDRRRECRHLYAEFDQHRGYMGTEELEELLGHAQQLTRDIYDQCSRDCRAFHDSFPEDWEFLSSQDTKKYLLAYSEATSQKSKLKVLLRSESPDYEEMYTVCNKYKELAEILVRRQWEDKLSDWSQRLGGNLQASFRRMERAIRGAIIENEDVFTRFNFPMANIRVQLLGSCNIRTNTKHSDVDVGIYLQGVNWNEDTYKRFKYAVLFALATKFGARHMKRGNRVLGIAADNRYGVKAEIMPALLYRDQDAAGNAVNRMAYLGENGRNFYEDEPSQRDALLAVCRREAGTALSSVMVDCVHDKNIQNRGL